MLDADSGSFKDPDGRVYHAEGRVLRGLSAAGATAFADLEKTEFFSRWLREGKIIDTKRLPDSDPAAREATSHGWAAALEHRRVPFVSYPYEWPFAMLKDAALLLLDMQAECFEEGWTLKDATPYNIQWLDGRPVWIDTPSLQPREEGAPWVGYRQFCMTFLYPLMLKAHLGADYAPLLRARLDGAPPEEIRRYFYGLKSFKKGVLPHVIFPALAEAAARRRATSADEPAKKRQQPLAVSRGLIHGLRNTVRKLSRAGGVTAWSDYERSHSYGDADVEAKRAFVQKCAASKNWDLAWDLGCNTGAYSEICAAHADCVVAVDGDDAAVERLYLSRRGGGKILPLVMPLENMSPAQGWRGGERAAFVQRGRPGLVLCLALLHHLRISCNIPLALILDWLRGLDAAAVVEFVGREDEMTRALLANKPDAYDDYQAKTFELLIKERFAVEDTASLKGGARLLYFLRPR